MSERDWSKSSRMPRKHLADYILAVAFDIAFLVIVNKIPEWNIPFITDTFPGVLWALNTSIVVSLAGNLILIFFHPRFLHHLLNALFALIGILALSLLLSVFPFDFADLVGDWLNKLLRVVLIAAIVGSAIGAVVHLVKAAAAIFRGQG
jgi:hypothetical protein